MTVKAANRARIVEAPSAGSPHTNGTDAPVPTASRKDLLGIEHLERSQILSLIKRSDDFNAELSQTKRLEDRDTLAGLTVANLFFENSTRTRTSFELAEMRLGADHVSLSPAISSLTKGESLLDTVRVLEAMKLDAIVVRHSSAGVPAFLAERLPSHVRIINAGDGAHEHPTQALLDAASLIERIGDLSGKQILIVGDIRHSRVARSNIWLLQKLGAKIILVGPRTLIPKGIEEIFDVKVSYELEPELANADAVIALRIQQERQTSGLFPTLQEYHERYGLTKHRLRNSNAIVLHPGPINLGVELDANVAYGERSLVLRQVKRGVAIRMAVLEWLFDDTTR
jgi:aspartate carbamoyltransferase catalytic subunit